VRDRGCGVDARERHGDDEARDLLQLPRAMERSHHGRYAPDVADELTGDLERRLGSSTR
jgi:hypothetical protein